MSPSPLLTNATLALSLLASALLQVTLTDRQGTPWPGLVHLALAAVVAGAITVLDRRSGAIRPWGIGVGFALLCLGPFLYDGITRTFFYLGDPYEVRLVGALRNAMLGFTAMRSQHRAQAIACFTSLFLVLFAFLWTMNVASVALLIVYSVLGMWWLMGAYWDRLSGAMANRTESAVPIGSAGLAIGLGLLGLLMAAPLARTTGFTVALNGFMPSSGGTQWTDNQAFGGVGDGDQMVKGKDQASSFGPIESELFLESEMPSLYDVFNELSDAVPPKKKNKRRRAIPLAPTLMQENHVHRGKTEKAGREFEAIRRPPADLPQVGDRRSDALIHLTGRVPVHLALEAYDLWDGRTLSNSGVDRTVAVKLDDEPNAHGDRWLRPSRSFPKDLFTHADYRAVKFINLRSDTVPAPPNTDALLLDKAHTVGLFGSTRNGDLRLDVDFIPQLTMMHLRSRVRPADSTPYLKRSSPAESGERLAQLAAEWTTGLSRGWPQVRAICERLRAEYVHDRQAVAPEDCDDAVEHFLFEAKRGPNYLFATSTAVLLRTLGYETRVRSGFYAREENYNVLARSTAVYKEDAHFWVEVLAAGGMWFDPDGKGTKGHWLTLEPTPGYEVLHEPPTYWMLITSTVASAWEAVAGRPVRSTLAVVTATLAVWLRAPIADRLVTLWWLIASRFGGGRRLARETVLLLRRRAWLRRRPLPGTLGRWDLFPGRDDRQELRREFVEIASWALYGEGTRAVASSAEVRRVCHLVGSQALRCPLRRARSKTS